MALGTGTLNMVGAGSLTVTTSANVGGTLNASDGIISAPAFTINSLMMNSGTVNFNAGASSVSSPTFNSGNLNAAGGTVSLPTNTQFGGALRLNGGSATVAGTLNLAGGSIVGGTPGTLTANINQTGGTISPGLSPGLLNVTGNFTQAAGADINFEIFGTGGAGAANGHDQINITGDVTADVDFNVTVDPGYTPTLGDTFTIATATGTTMGNNTLNLPDISAFGFEFSDSASNPSALILTVVALGCTINFDNDNGNGLWQEAANWDTDVVPALTDDACIGVGAAGGPLHRDQVRYRGH